MPITRRRALKVFLALAASCALPALAGAPRRIDVWKDPNCGCCTDWIVHLEKSGFQVVVHDAGNDDMRARLGMPARYGSCHTARIDGYLIEGHVPASDIEHLLKEKPRALGLAVPGMPVGSPGMDGPAYKGRRDPFDVLLISADGNSHRVFKAYR